MTRLIGEIFGPYLTEEDKRAYADMLTEALMREHLARMGAGRAYTAKRKYDPRKLIPRWLADDWTADQLHAIISEYSERDDATKGIP
jgi:hypothetical protein